MLLPILSCADLAGWLACHVILTYLRTYVLLVQTSSVASMASELGSAASAPYGSETGGGGGGGTDTPVAVAAASRRRRRPSVSSQPMPTDLTALLNDNQDGSQAAAAAAAKKKKPKKRKERDFGIIVEKINQYVQMKKDIAAMRRAAARVSEVHLHMHR